MPRPDIDAMRRRLADLPHGERERWVAHSGFSNFHEIAVAPEISTPVPDEPNSSYTFDTVCYMSAWLHSSYGEYAHDPDICTRRGRFIAHAPEDMRALLAYIEELEAR